MSGRRENRDIEFSKYEMTQWRNDPHRPTYLMTYCAFNFNEEKWKKFRNIKRGLILGKYFKYASVLVYVYINPNILLGFMSLRKSDIR